MKTIQIAQIKNTNLLLDLEIPENLTILDNLKDPKPINHNMFRIMTPRDGDKRVVWDSRDFVQITEAKEMFDQLVAEGLVPYRVGVNGKASPEVMDEFDVHAEEVLFVPIQLAVGG